MTKDYKIEMLKMSKELSELFLEKASAVDQNPRSNHDLGILSDASLILEELNDFDKAVFRALPMEAAFKRITNKHKRVLALINGFKTVIRIDRKEFAELGLYDRAIRQA